MDETISGNQYRMSPISGDLVHTLARWLVNPAHRVEGRALWNICQAYIDLCDHAQASPSPAAPRIPHAATLKSVLRNPVQPHGESP